MTDFRALCSELVDVLADHCGDNEFAWGLVDRASAALAEPVGEGPSMPAAINDMPEAQRRWYALGWRAAIASMADPFRLEPEPVGDGPTPSLKEQALLTLEDIPNIDSAHYNIIQRALEQLND